MTACEACHEREALPGILAAGRLGKWRLCRSCWNEVLRAFNFGATWPLPVDRETGR